MGYLRCKGGSHLHEFMTSGWSREPKLLFAIEVEFGDEMERSVSTGWALLGDDHGHRWQISD